MQDISDLLQSRQPKEPPQLQALRDYCLNNHQTKVNAGTGQFGYSITVPNAPLASTLQMEMPQIQVACNLDKKLFIRIGMVK